MIVKTVSDFKGQLYTRHISRSLGGKMFCLTFAKIVQDGDTTCMVSKFRLFRGYNRKIGLRKNRAQPKLPVETSRDLQGIISSHGALVKTFV